MKITRDQFLAATVNQISQVYKGKRRCCRCGCGGKYVATTFMIRPRTDEINDKLVARRLKRAQEMLLRSQQLDVDFGDTYVDIEIRENVSLTFYFDEI